MPVPPRRAAPHPAGPPRRGRGGIPDAGAHAGDVPRRGRTRGSRDGLWRPRPSIHPETPGPRAHRPRRPGARPAPVLVGHYRDDPIVSAERYLDRQLGGRRANFAGLACTPGRSAPTSSCSTTWPPRLMSTPAPSWRDSGWPARYTGPPHTHHRAGDSSRLRRRGLRTVAAFELSAEPGMAMPPRLGVGLTALLIGGGGSGVSMIHSLRAILRAVILANTRHAQPDATAPSGPTPGDARAAPQPSSTAWTSSRCTRTVRFRRSGSCSTSRAPRRCASRSSSRRRSLAGPAAGSGYPRATMGSGGSGCASTRARTRGCASSR